MEQALQSFLLFLMWIMTISNAAELLKNPDFEIPPLNTTSNTTSQFLLLNRSANPIPGWSINGTVWYATMNNISHALQLGENGKINQTFRGSGGYMDHILSFSIAARDEECGDNNRTAVSVSVSVRGRPYYGKSEVFFLRRDLSKNLWENHAFYMGGFDSSDSIDLEIGSVGTNSWDHNETCWPLVDKFTIQRNGMPRWYDGNMLANGDFEIGPAFLKNSSEGILLQEKDEPTSPLQGWSILGTIKYINSKNYKIPHGKAAIQLLYGAPAPSGVQIQFKNLPITSTYTLNFTIGDANDSCVGDFIVYVQVGQNVHDFTLRSNGTGTDDYKHSIRFKGDESYLRDTSISFYSLNVTTRRDGVLCGPVLDNVVLVRSNGERKEMSNGERKEMSNGVLVWGLFVALMMLIV